ncbi:hypothetical protein CH373_14515 [Leptospira perolatii]|uniref:Polyketide cyclase n=1 Tax=Leptospira perolatii TaxID=2023191 RepID=A0A2M9ZK57_9LEPT|nr:SRPBCC family protein [Leptospira perolatii]PJZ69254.1 hypothetical protein CH360_12105 [Leptospira perolatii]PJZ72364.1 hypothetical protein CH373_14515 [Leptospira perolatii]
MNQALTYVGIAVGIVALIVLSGYLLPKDHVATVEKEYQTSPEKIYQTIRNFKDYASWRTGVASVEAHSDTTWSEVNKDNEKIKFGIKSENYPKYCIVEILNEDLPFGGYWEFEISSKGGNASVLKLTENGFVTNPIYRLMSRFVFGHTATLVQYQEDLFRKINQQ